MIDHAEILEWAARYDGPLFHALLCDPPYHLTSITDRYGRPDSAPNKFGSDGLFQRAARGFMNATWDGGDIAFRPETWAALGRLLHPGAFMMAFAGTRGYHRMATAIEDAGFILHPVIAWSFGSGFPKATRIKNETCTCEESETVSKYYMSDMRQAGIQEAEFNGEAENNNLQQVMQPESKSANATGKPPRQGQSRRKERFMEGRSNVSTATRQLRVSSVCAMPSAFIVNGTARRLRDGTSTSDSNGLQAATGTDRSCTSRRPQSTQQPTEQPGIVAGQPKPQDVGTRQHCDRCGLPIIDVWSGHRYGGQVLKPAIELICVAQKPYAGRPVDSITRTGAGAINVEASRIAGLPGESLDGGGYQTTVGHEGWDRPYRHDESRRDELEQKKNDRVAHAESAGRWPSNLLLSHSPDCNGECIPSCPVRRLGEQSGESESKAAPRGGVNIGSFAGIALGTWEKRDSSDPRGHDDSGTAARYFFNSDYALERLEAADPLMYFPKASTTEREAGLNGFDPTNDTHVAYGEYKGVPGKHTPNQRNLFPESTINDGRKKSIDNAYQRGETTRRNTHPTIKPISLARHLATLLLPPDLYAPRRLLVPFAGAGSEMIGAMLAGWEDVQGVELEADHVAIARARIAFWQQMKYKLMNPDTPVKVTINRRAPDGQLDMFNSFMDEQRTIHDAWIENPPTFKEWHAATGGLREEYDQMSLSPMTHEEWLRAHAKSED